MAFSKIGFHIAANCGGCTGIAEHWQALDAAGVPFTVYAANDGGAIAVAARFANATLIYRDVVASTVEPSDYFRDPEAMAQSYWEGTKAVLPAEIGALKGRVWLELLNETGKDEAQANWVGRLMYHMARRALAEGWRVMGPGWALGNPEPEHWTEPGWELYLRLCAAHPAQVAVSLHEYSSDNDIHFAEGYLIGRYEFLLDACEEMGIAFPRIFITECGWTYNSMPPDAQAKEDIAYLAQIYARHGAVQTAHLWTLQSGEGNGDLPQRLNALMPWLTQYTITARFPDSEPPAEPLPVSNLLKNPSFELSWTPAGTFPGHIPAGWTAWYNVGEKFPNPFGGQPYKNGEAVRKEKKDLPPHEQDVFIWDGNACYKVFGGGDKSFWFVMRQELTLAPGRYRLVLPLWVDHYKKAADGGKDYHVDPNQAQAKIAINKEAVNSWVSLPTGGKREVRREFDHAGGAVTLDVHLRSNWDINGNFFADGWSLEAVGAPTPEPEKHKAIVVKLPQDMTAAEWNEAAAYAFPFRHTMTASHDDMLTVLRGGSAESYVKLIHAERQADVKAMITAAGYRWEAVELAEELPPFEL